MNYTVVTKPAFKLIGVKIRTSNQAFMQEVPPLWKHFEEGRLAEQIPNRLDDMLIILYSEYEADYTQPFSYTMGCRVDQLEAIPAGMVGIEIPKAHYAVYTAKGEMPDCMVQTWQQIWQDDAKLKRSYRYDFEVYSKTAQAKKTVEIPIYIGI